MNSGYFPVVVNPGVRPQTEHHIPFYFGGSQVPNTLGIKGGAFLGKDGKVHTSMKGMPSKTHKGDMDYTTKKGDKVYHRDGHNVKLFGRPYRRIGAVRTFSK